MIAVAVVSVVVSRFWGNCQLSGYSVVGEKDGEALAVIYVLMRSCDSN
jgi:hypothetical protein